MSSQFKENTVSTHRNRRLSRRDFLARSGAASAWAVAVGAAPSAAVTNQPLPTRTLGKTGVEVPVLGLGTAPAGDRPRKEAAWFYHQAISAGVTYLDTAPRFAGYGIAQKALGDVLKERRDEVFLVTKCFEPDGEKALELLKRNLKELQTDYADVVYAHSIGDQKMDLDTVLGKQGVMAALEKARDDGLCRFVGISGHNRPAKFLKVMEEFDIEVMMNAVNPVIRHVYNFEEHVWPAARQKNIGLVAMKVLGGQYKSEAEPAYKPRAKGGRITGDDMEPAFRYAMGLPGTASVVLGCYNFNELEEAIGWTRKYKPLSDKQRNQLLAEGKSLAEQWGEVHGPAGKLSGPKA
jgi:hypothetical protein